MQAEELDVLREPRLVEADPHFAGKTAEEVVDELQRDMGNVITIACSTDRPCCFLGDDNQCTIYPTRPNDCVAMQAGDDQCQDARQQAGLPPLEPNDDP